MRCDHAALANATPGGCPLCPQPVPTIGGSFAREDGWTSALTGINRVGTDKRLSYSWAVSPISVADATALRAGNDLAATIVEDKPGECWREGFELSIPDDKDLATELMDEWETLGVEHAFRSAHEWERQYGGAAIVIGANDGVADLRMPLGTVRELRYLAAYEPIECQPTYYYGDPLAPKYCEPAIYQLTPTTRGLDVAGNAPASTFEVHESRIIAFGGTRVSRTNPDIGVTVPGWGISVLTRVQSVLRGFDLTWDAAELLVIDFAQAIYKMKGLAEAIAGSGDGLKNRVKAFNLARSQANVALIDADEEFSREQTPLTALPAMMEVFQARLAAAAGMPITRLFGRSPAGMNATGEGDAELYDDAIKVEQSKRIAPRLAQLVRLQMQVRGVNPEQWAIIPRPLKQQSDAERTAGRKSQSEIDVAYIDRGVLSPAEVRESRFGGDEYSYETGIDVDAIDDLETPDADPAELLDPATPSGGETDIAKTAMNGAQVTSLLDVVTRVGAGELSRESAIGVLVIAFQLTEAEAAKVLGPENFEPKKPDPPPMPFGGPPPPAPDDDVEPDPDDPGEDDEPPEPESVDA